MTNNLDPKPYQTAAWGVRSEFVREGFEHDTVFAPRPEYEQDFSKYPEDINLKKRWYGEGE